ncbi:hypothetical protein Y1Q_0015908 [Alligator mississippiensis]|uniref:Uncharacterized protein n=1 Tax=Alligator mississippiensis TaxID=8496 RepID=A0A151MHF5_ALLMI|nr:hypothetical protein Y1Q_0015908 [Alligator mississippiensis]
MQHPLPQTKGEVQKELKPFGMTLSRARVSRRIDYCFGKSLQLLLKILGKRNEILMVHHRFNLLALWARRVVWGQAEGWIGPWYLELLAFCPAHRHCAPGA